MNLFSSFQKNSQFSKQNEVIHQLSSQFSHQDFSQVIKERKLLVSPSGRYFAQLQKKDPKRKTLELIYDKKHFPTDISQGVLLLVNPQEIIFWGKNQKTGFSGTYSMGQNGLTFLERLDFLDQVIPSPAGLMLRGHNSNDNANLNRYILPHNKGFILTKKNTSISLYKNGEVTFIEERYEILQHTIWKLNGSVEIIRNFPDHKRVQVLPWQEGFAYLLDEEDFFVFEGQNKLQKNKNFRYEYSGKVKNFWAGPNYKHTFFLVERPERGNLEQPFQQMFFDGKVVKGSAGYFQMKTDDLRWSRDGEHFIAHIKMFYLDFYLLLLINPELNPHQ